MSLQWNLYNEPPDNEQYPLPQKQYKINMYEKEP